MRKAPGNLLLADLTDARDAEAWLFALGNCAEGSGTYTVRGGAEAECLTTKADSFSFANSRLAISAHWLFESRPRYCFQWRIASIARPRVWNKSARL